MRLSLPSLLFGLAIFPAFLVGCGKEIGDPCRTSIDCSINGDRTCDISQPGGYCTVEGCDERSCPNESTCVRFFPTRFLEKACNVRLEDISVDAPDNDCRPEEVCLAADGAPAGSTAGVCAPRSTERRFCAKTCKSDGDCRGGYVCRAYFALGAYPFTEQMRDRKFCAPELK